MARIDNIKLPGLKWPLRPIQEIKVKERQSEQRSRRKSNPLRDDEKDNRPVDEYA
jgi:hypothetical protein